MPKDSVINVGIIGCGGIARVRLNGYKSLRDAGYSKFRIKALCDINPEAIKHYRSKDAGYPRSVAPAPYKHYFVDDFQPEFVPEAYTDHRQMLKKAGIDAVDIYTGDATHHSLAIDSLNAGKHAMVEKPMAITVAAGKRMVEAADAGSLVLATAHCFRFEEIIRAARFAVDQGILGHIQVISWCNVGRGQVSTMKDRTAGIWRLSRFNTAGEALENGCHFMDSVRYMVGEVDQVLGRVETFDKIRRDYDASGKVLKEYTNENNDAFFAIILFQNGAVGQISHVNDAHGEPLNQEAISFALYGSKGCIKRDQMILDDGERSRTGELLDAQAPADLKSRLFPLGLKDRYALEVHDFLEAIRNGRQAEVSGREGLRDIVASWAIIESSALGCAVKADEVQSGEIAACQEHIDKHLGLV